MLVLVVQLVQSTITDDAVDTAATALASLSPDPAPEAITNATHYWVSNERRLDLFADDVRDLGGVYLGVGTDQSYVLAGWARPELVVLVDFDQDVVDLHAVYGVLLSHAETPRAFVASWTEGGAPSAEAALVMAIPDPERRARLVALYRDARPLVLERFTIMQAKLREAGERSFLDEPEQYAHLRSLHVERRIIALRGDFTRAGVLRPVARVLSEARLNIRVLYLSNIEQYFMYGRDYKDNIVALPVDDRSIVLRTLPARPAGFEYIVQSAIDLQAWLRSKRVRSVYRIRGLSKGDALVAGRRHAITGTPPP